MGGQTRAVPHGGWREGRVSIDRSLYDDVVAELQLAVFEGRLEIDQVAGAVRSFVSRGRSAWQSAYRRSLDAHIGDDGKRTRGDLLEDETTTAQIEQLELGSGS